MSSVRPLPSPAPLPETPQDAPVAVPKPKPRISAIDLARGIAIALMILSHGVKGLLDFEQFPGWGLVPVHAVTKFSSSLFILVFGMALAVASLPHAGSPEWPARRNALMLRGIVILFWYKVLTIAEMGLRSEPQAVIDALLYRAFPVFTEILGFYGIALLWLPLVLPIWKRLPLPVKLAIPLVFAASSWWLSLHFGFWGSEPLQALLVEHENHYTWGQLARAPLIFLGLLAGEAVLTWQAADRMRPRAVALFAAASAILFVAFFAVTAGRLDEEMMSIARNAGKHPPELAFMLFSVAGACGLLAACFLGGDGAARFLRPLTAIGRNPLQAFIVHIFVLCVFYRDLLGFWRTVSYEEALRLTGLLFVITWLWIELLGWLQRRRRPR